MNATWAAAKKQSGFTLVELLIVVVIIAVLAAITIVAYTGVQNRALDAKTSDGMEKVAKALVLWSLDHGNSITGGSGSTTALGASSVCADGGGQGWAATGTYSCTLEDMLTAAGYLPKNYISSLPNNPTYPSTGYSTGKYSAMIYKCGSTTGLYVLLWSLRQPSATDTANLNNAITQCGVGTTATTYNMKSARIIQL